MKLKIVCSWCSRSMGQKDCDSVPKGLKHITHSICPECKEKVMQEIEEDFVQTPTIRTKFT